MTSRDAKDAENRQATVDQLVDESNAVAREWQHTKRSLADRLDALRRILPHDSPLADALVTARDDIRSGVHNGR